MAFPFQTFRLATRKHETNASVTSEKTKRRFDHTKNSKSSRAVPAIILHHPNQRSNTPLASTTHFYHRIIIRHRRVPPCPSSDEREIEARGEQPSQARKAATMGKHKDNPSCHDAEVCYPPGAPASAAASPYLIENPQMRWAFIRKVYAIVAMQMMLTVAVAGTVNLVEPIRAFFQARTVGVLVAYVLILISPIIVMIPMILWRKKHPVNLVLLALFTVCVSLTVGVACLSKNGRVIGEAAAITLVVVVGLTLYTFWADKKGYDFEFLGPFLVAAVLILVLFSLIRVLFPMGKTATMVYGCVAALVFSGFIIYDTDNLIKRCTYDEYVSAAIELYLDIINLFMAILSILEGTD